MLFNRVVGLIVIFVFTTFGPVIAGDTEPLPGDFNDSGTYVPDDSSVERTYTIPDIDAGLMSDNESYRIRPNFGIELDEREIADWEVKTDLIIAEDAIGISPMWKVTSIIETSIGPVGIYDTKENEYGVGITVMMTKF